MAAAALSFLSVLLITKVHRYWSLEQPAAAGRANVTRTGLQCREMCSETEISWEFPAKSHFGKSDMNNPACLHVWHKDMVLEWSWCVCVFLCVCKSQSMLLRMLLCDRLCAWREHLQFPHSVSSSNTKPYVWCSCWNVSPPGVHFRVQRCDG